MAALFREGTAERLPRLDVFQTTPAFSPQPFDIESCRWRIGAAPWTSNSTGVFLRGRYASGDEADKTRRGTHHQPTARISAHVRETETPRPTNEKRMKHGSSGLTKTLRRRAA